MELEERKEIERRIIIKNKVKEREEGKMEGHTEGQVNLKKGK